MAILRIYGDEAGTMPQDDNGDVFVTATVSIWGDHPSINKPNGHLQWLIDQFKALNAVPSVAFIKPIPGYGNGVKKKLDKMNIMARVTRLITGANAQYLTQEGIPLRNYIWIFCMGQAIGQATVKGITRENIDKIDIVLDKKTMPVPIRNLFKSQIQKVPRLLGEILEQAKQINPQQVTIFQSRLKFSQDTVSLGWSDEINNASSKGGLDLAHYLASHYHKGLKRSNNPTIKLLLSQSGFRNIDIDFTDRITSIDPRAIKNWEIITGLREPNVV